jgi:macrolide transport system ATP-binding/permease protein
MSWLKQLLSRRRRYNELSESIREHLDEKIADLMDRGMTQEQAESTARREFGNVTRIEERSREVWQWPTLESTWADVRYALRRLGRSPGFAITVILTIALGIGANTAIFTLIHAILMKSLPVNDPQSLCRIGDSYKDCCFTNGLENDNGDFDIFSYDAYRYLQKDTPEFEQLAAVQSDERRISVRRGESIAKSERSEYVSGNYFNTFGIEAFAGRVFTDADDASAAPPVAILSYRAWQSDYARDPSVVGSTFYLQNQPVTIIGIAPPGFYGDRISANPPAFWIPLSDEPLLTQANSILHQPIACWLYLIGRIRPGTAIGSLQQKISINLRQWLSIQDEYRSHGFPARIPRVHVVIVPGGEGIQSLQQETEQKLYLLLSITILVLLVACANVANLMLARGVKQEVEMSVRVALGSTRSRLIRQMLTESVLLGCMGGGLAGLVLANMGTLIILAFAFPDSVQSAIDARPSLTVLGFAFVLSLITGIVFGILPALVTSHADPAEALRGANRSIGSRASLLQKTLIVLQAAFSLVLLMGMGLLTKSLQDMEHQNFGLQTSHRYVLHLDPAGAGYKPEKLATLNQALELQLSGIPGMQKVGLAMYSPLDGNAWTDSVFLPGKPVSGPNDDNGALLDRVSSNFFAAVGQPVIRGREFNQDDTENSQFVAVVNEAFAKKFFPNEDPIGHHFGIYEHDDIGAYEIVGVVADAKYTAPRTAAQPMFFEPLSQWQHKLKDPIFVNLETQTHYATAVVMEFHGTQQDLEATVRRMLANIDPNLVILNLTSLDSQLMSNFSQEQLVARLTSLFGLLALFLTSLGLYGITSYQTEHRTREIGLRMALGATRRRVIGLVMRSALVLVVLGLSLGIPLTLACAHCIAGQLYAVKAYDPLTLFIASSVLLGAAMLASFVPARRASSIDPMQVLRSE